MKPEWIEFTGSDEQIEEIMNSESDTLLNVAATYILKSKIFQSDLHSFLKTGEISHYLICKPHQYSEMIDQWRQTGQPVYWRSKNSRGSGMLCQSRFPPFAYPDKFEYRFAPFEEE